MHFRLWIGTSDCTLISQSCFRTHDQFNQINLLCLISAPFISLWCMCIFRLDWAWDENNLKDDRRTTRWWIECSCRCWNDICKNQFLWLQRKCVNCYSSSTFRRNTLLSMIRHVEFICSFCWVYPLSSFKHLKFEILESGLALNSDLIRFRL